jgi:hypothetical protein
VALVAFDDDVYENHAYTRERLARPGEAPRPIGAAIEQWLGLGRRTWVDMRGRQIEGVATARELGRDAWLIDALIDASPPGEEAPVLQALLGKAHDAAIEDRVTHVVLRTRSDSSAVNAALHCGFKQVVLESVWSCRLGGGGAAPDGIVIRRVEDSDEHPRFQLFNRVMPLDAREAIALTLEEWQRTRERRWLNRGGTEWVAVEGDTVVGELLLSGARSEPQLELIVEDQRTDVAAALLDYAGSVFEEREGDGVAVAITSVGGASEAALSDRGRAQGEFVLLCLRLAKPIAETRGARATLALPTRG